MDGHYGGTLDIRLSRADAVVFLDRSTAACLLGVVRRWVGRRIFGRDRDDVVKGNPERLDPGFLRYVWRFRREHRPRLLRRLGAANALDRTVVLRSSAEIERFVHELTRCGADRITSDPVSGPARSPSSASAFERQRTP